MRRLRTPGIDEIEACGIHGQQLAVALDAFGTKGFHIERLAWSVGEHPPGWYRERGIGYIVLNEEIRARVFLDPSLREMQRNYREVEHECTQMERIDPLDGYPFEMDGPAITVYRLPP